MDIFLKDEIDNETVEYIHEVICDNIFDYKMNRNIKVKVALKRLSKDIKKCETIDVFSNKELINTFKDSVRNIIRDYNLIADNNLDDDIASIKDLILKLIYKIATIEYLEFKNYENKIQEVVDIYDVLSLKECQKSIFKIGIIKCIEEIYLFEKTKEKIKCLIPFDPKDEYQTARQIKRHFIIHVGETNTGKTYSALQDLKIANRGAYLAPLRLLALEVQEKLKSEGLKCDLITGEEEDIIIGSTHISSTVEKVNLEKFYNICVLDECQMISDEFRGYAWTKVILGILAETIHLCTAPEAKNILIKIIESCNDTYEVVEHFRDTQLICEKKNFNFTNVNKGDALIVFSKRSALAVACELINKGIKTSIIYGSLPYTTRKKQFQRFINGETDVVVCTDAIGMGVNLPIRRVVFLQNEKFDGKGRRSLNISEIKQISGRAGRKGIYNEGYVTSLKGNIFDLLQKDCEEINEVFIGFSDSLLEIDKSIINILKAWKSIDVPIPYVKTDILRNINLIQELYEYEDMLNNREMFKLSCLPFDENNTEVKKLWLNYIIEYVNDTSSLLKPICYDNDLNNLETYYKSLDLYYSFSKAFSLEIDFHWLIKEKENTANKINNILVKEISKYSRKCNYCGDELLWDYPYNVCSKCFEISQNFNYYLDELF